MPPPETEVPKRIGRYDIERVLGEGAMGVVYEGNDTRLHRKVAIKTILKSALDSDSAKEYSMRFAREAQAVARLNHANIVQVFDYAEEGEVAYIVMEFVKGKELKNFFDAKERFELKEVVHIMGELCDALHFAHEAGIIHRDIKPANVMIDSQGRVKLTDFGVARITDADRKQSEKTQAGTVVGTPAYMSPEQIQSGNLDRRTDVFSAGVILYEFLTGEKPFTGSGAWTIAKKILQEEPKRPSQINNTLSPLFDAVVEKALCKNPDGRYRSARDFGMALKRALEGLPETDEVERTVKMPALRLQGGQIAPVEPVGDPTMLRTVPAAAPTPASAGANEIEIEFWRSIKDGKDPEQFDVYLERFPSGIYAALARRRGDLLRSGAAADPKATQSIDMEREIAEAARRESEAKAKLAEEKAEMEANLARREAEFQKREAEAQAKLAEEKARHEAEVARREADFRKQEAGRKKALVMALTAAVIAAVGGGLWYALKPPDPLAQRVAELTQMLEESKKREAALLQSRQREAELMRELELAREREAEALKSGDVARQREFAEQIRQREAEAKKQAELTRQREAEAKRQAEIAEQRRAEIARLQGRPAKKAEPAKPAEEARPEPVAPAPAAEPVKAPEPARPAEAKSAGAKAPEARAGDSKASEPLKMAAVTAVPPAAVPVPEPGAVSPEGQLQRAIALEGEGRNAEAVRLLRQVARGKGRTAGLAAKRLGDLMQKKGVPGVSYDYAEALKYYQIARDNGIELDVAKGR